MNHWVRQWHAQSKTLMPALVFHDQTAPLEYPVFVWRRLRRNGNRASQHDKGQPRDNDKRCQREQFLRAMLFPKTHYRVWQET
jgi:hypothetical protein